MAPGATGAYNVGSDYIVTTADREPMGARNAGSIGEFEHLVLLAILQLRDRARALDIRKQIRTRADRNVSRGALYTTLERLGAKGLVTWRAEKTSPARGGIPRRLFQVTEAGMEAVRASQQAIRNLSSGLDEILREGGGWT